MAVATRPAALSGVTVHLRPLGRHPHQAMMVHSTAKRLVVRAGRRGGKTVGAATRAVTRFLQGRRQLYAAPVSGQTDKFWQEVCLALQEPIAAGYYRKNESERYIELVGTEQRIKAKTAWSPDTLRGDYADDLYLDEWQLMDEETWESVGAPMLADHDGDAVFIYTPPSLRSAGVSKARDPRHAAKMFKMASEDKRGRWQTLHFTSHDNPYISEDALRELMGDMSKQSYRQEILAEDDEIQLSWLVYKAFNESACKIEPRVIPAHWPRYVGHDFGGANPAALFVAQDPNTGYIHIYGEYLPGAGRSIAEHVAEFKRQTSGLLVDKRVGGSHQEDEIRQGYQAYGWPILEPGRKEVAYQVDRVIRLMELNRVLVHSTCYRLLEELMNCLWEIDREGKPTNRIADEAKFHLLACARYLLSDFQPELAVVREQPVWRW